ncbi:DUF4287 domain-containing protein [Phenylobacterium sp.]|uniref:DUF4287 domain-containing protein n=1 Tax=Phenylobacterium sp. TaxID=1871053 RepID=UPI001220548D|nr:DUF4287 domain-containing protein [Phenylobacterium sp.]THD63499.1 MAG: DUF4287 domain-containing protein [Phenylobacterium sp.]
MAAGDDKLTPPSGLSPRQQKWFASVQASLERDTGKTLEEWVAIARTCPETKPRAQAAWFKANYGLLQNRAMHVLSVAFPSETGGWAEADALREALWADPASRAILEAAQAAATALPDVVMGQRKQFTAFSREFQFASLRPVKGGKAMLGLALAPDADPRLEAPKNESWSERLKARMLLESPADLDPALLRQAWERS